VGRLTAWGYGKICWILEKWYATAEGSRLWGPRFRILKGLPPDLTLRERQVVMAALLHDLVDTTLHPSKLGRPVPIPDPYGRWLCVQHHAAQTHPDNPDLQLLREAGRRTSRYARLLPIFTSRRKLTPVDTHQVARKLAIAAHRSVYALYSVIYHSQELNSYVASKAHPTETLRYHLLGVANWMLFRLRTSRATSVALAGEPGGTPGPVEVEDPRIVDEP